MPDARFPEPVAARPHARSQTIRRIVLRRGAGVPTLVRAPAPRAPAGAALVRSLLVGIDGTDEEILEGEPPDFPPGKEEMVLGHECLGEVVEAPEGSGLAPGDRVVPLVRHACGVCALCAGGRVDLCSSGRYVEHGLRGLDGFLADAWADDPRTLVRVPDGLADAAVFAEPLAVVLKTLETVVGVQRRIPAWGGLAGKRVLLAGTGSLGSLAMFELAREGALVWALDRSPDDAAGPRLLRRLGARHVRGDEGGLEDATREAGGFDVVLEATGSPRVAFDAILSLRENGIACLMGVPPRKPAIPLEADDVMRGLVLRNQCVVGCVNSARRHVELALARLAGHAARWPGLVDDVLTHRYAPEEATEAFRAGGPDLVKKAIDWR